MARVPGKLTKIYVDEFDFSGRVSAAEQTVDVELPPVTTFGDSAEEVVEAVYRGVLIQNSFFDGDSGGIDDEMWADIVSGSDHLVGFYPGNSALQGVIGYELQARPDEQSRPVEVAGAVMLNVTWQGFGPIVRATVLNNAAVTASGVITGSNKNIGATAAGEKFVAVIRCLAFNGTTITVDIEESSNDGGGDAYALISGIQQVITALGSWRLTTISATEAWKRVNITAFTGTSMTLLIVVGKEAGVS